MNWLVVALIAGRRETCTIVEISRTGAKIRLGRAIAPGTEIERFGERFGSLEATVVWSKGDLAGVQFIEPPPQVETKLKPLVPELQHADAPAPRRPPTFGRRPAAAQRRVKRPIPRPRGAGWVPTRPRSREWRGRGCRAPGRTRAR